MSENGGQQGRKRTEGHSDWLRWDVPPVKVKRGVWKLGRPGSTSVCCGNGTRSVCHTQMETIVYLCVDRFKVVLVLWKSNASAFTFSEGTNKAGCERNISRTVGMEHIHSSLKVGVADYIPPCWSRTSEHRSCIDAGERGQKWRGKEEGAGVRRDWQLVKAVSMIILTAPQ